MQRTKTANVKGDNLLRYKFVIYFFPFFWETIKIFMSQYILSVNPPMSNKRLLPYYPLFCIGFRSSGNSTKLVDIFLYYSGIS